MIRFARMPIEDSPWNDGRHALDVVRAYVRYVQGLGRKVANLLEASDSRTADNFLTGAQQPVARFNITTRAHKRTTRTSFRFSEQKEDGPPVTVFIIADASRIEAQKQVLGLLQWCKFQELKRHPNHKKPVYLIADEATNFKLHDLDSLLTWGRGYGLRIHLIFQNLPAFRKVYGKDALATLLSETEIKQFLPGQREPETLGLLEKSILGSTAYVLEGRSGTAGAKDYWLGGRDFREDGKPLMSVDEIRRDDKAILILRRNRPILTDLPPIAAIDPFRDQVDINPFHGKPFRLPVQLRLRQDGASLRLFRRRLARLFTRRPVANEVRKQRHARRSKGAFLASRVVGLWWLALIAAFLASPAGPHMLWSYSYRQSGVNGPRIHERCTYLGARGLVTPAVSYRCPAFLFIDSRNWRR